MSQHVAIVTGAGSGLEITIAKTFSGLQIHIVNTGRTEAKLFDACNAIGSTWGARRYCQCRLFFNLNRIWLHYRNILLVDRGNSIGF